MKNILIKISKILKKVFTILFCLLIIFLIATTAWNKVMSIKEDKMLEKVGTDVNVNGTNIRVSVTGEGDKTIVLLSGMGTPEPITDFTPLADKLSENYKVVTLEYAGYGLSDDSNEERSNKVVVEEIRETLSKLDIKPPYILMPHSISGIYSMAYMNMYPEEVEAMIGIDSAVPNQAKEETFKEVSDGLYCLAKFMDFTGLSRLSYLTSGSSFFDNMKASGSYSEEDMNNVASILCRKSISKAMLSEIRNAMDNCKSLYDVKCPDNIPILFLLSKDSCEEYVTWEELHEEVISNPNIQKIEYLDGKHYLHWTHYNEISDMAEKFIEDTVE